MREATAEAYWGTSGSMNTTRGRMVGGWTNERTNDSTRVESASTPRGVSAPMGSAIPDRDTRSREKKIERGKRARETKYTRKTE